MTSETGNLSVAWAGVRWMSFDAEPPSSSAMGEVCGTWLAWNRRPLVRTASARTGGRPAEASASQSPLESPSPSMTTTS